MSPGKRKKPTLWQLPVESLSFGGWGDYQTWADHDFKQRPQPDEPDAPETESGPQDDGAEQRVEDDAAEDEAAEPVGVAWPEEEPDAEMPVRRVLPRPYVRTSGRTTPGHELRVETVVTATRLDERAPGHSSLSFDLRRICQICRAPCSVAEVSAHLHLPIGAARVLLSDAIDAGWIVAYDAPLRDDGRPPLELLHRVYNGLRRLA